MLIDNKGLHFEEGDNLEKLAYDKGFKDGYAHCLNQIMKSMQNEQENCNNDKIVF